MSEDKNKMLAQLVHMRRVTRVTKGGKNSRSSVLVVVGNEKGDVGYGLGKSVEVPEAIKKATRAAERSMIRVNLFENRTIAHDISAKYCSSLVYLRKAKPGTGIVAGSAARYIFESLGIKDITCKILGRNRLNIVKAVFKALSSLKTPSEIAKIRGVSVHSLFAKNMNAKKINKETDNAS